MIILKWKDKEKHVEGLRILTHKHMLQRLPIAPAQVKAGNTSEHVLTIYELYE